MHLSESYSLVLEGTNLVWRKVGGAAKLRLANFGLQPLHTAAEAQAQIMGNRFFLAAFLSMYIVYGHEITEN